MRRLSPGFVIAPVFAAMLAACATSTSAPIVYGNQRLASATTRTTPALPPVSPDVFINAPQAPLLGELRVCGGTVSNVGPVSNNGRSLLFASYIFMPPVALMRAPIEDGCLSSGFGLRDIATGGENQKQHSGIDLANSHGGFVFSAAAGRIVSFGWRGDYGLALELDHGEGVHTLYAHLSAIDPRLAVGSPVAAGAAIARMGRTGNATGVHLHYEVSLYGLKLDPLRYGLPPVGQPAGPPADPAVVAGDNNAQPPA
ncbi:MAG: M23 family metallopeptidase [Alphaproteobacteria bacterium]